MAIKKVSYKGLRGIIPNVQDVYTARENVSQGEAYIHQLESLGFYVGNSVYDAAIEELKYSRVYRDECIEALAYNCGGRI